MPFQTWEALLVSQNADGTALANTTTATSIIHSAAKIVIPSNFMYYAGQALRIRAMGRISNIVTSPGTLTFNVKMGSVTAATSGAISLNVVAKTNVIWILDWDMTLRSTGGGTAATFMHSGQFQSESVVGSGSPTANGQDAWAFPTTAPAVGTGWDSTVDNVFDFQGAWSVANAGNSIQVHTFKLESLN